jgi:transcriptional regulator
VFLPPHFEETSVEALAALLRDHPLGMLVTLGAEGLNANHIPFLLDREPAPHGTLRGHVSRANPVWHDHSANLPALVVFQGPQAYVTPSWYATKPRTGRVVPTWNYAVVHAYGELRVFEDAGRLRALVERLTDANEAARPAPWRVADAPEEYIAQQLRGIVGIEIPITRLLGKFKMSQNRDRADREGVVEGLRAEGGASAAAVAALVRRSLD